MPAVTPMATAAGTAGVQNIRAIIPQFDSYAEQTFNRSSVPGMAVAIVKNDTVVYLRCFGVKNITTREPVTPDTRFQLASISKTFTATTIASMVGNGELSWDDRIVALNPDFQLSDPWVTEHVTIRDLLTHRSGLPAYGGDELQDSFGYNRSEIFHRLRYLGLTGEFRSSYAYSNIGITLAAEAAGKKAKKTWEDLVTGRVFVPAGMYNTSARFADFATSADHADTYPTVNGTSVPGPLQDDDVCSPAGGVSSTINDMTRYARLQLNDGSIDGRQVVNASALRDTHTPQNIMKYTGTSITLYDLGWETVYERGHRQFEHGGDFSNGVSTSITLYPEENMSVIVLTNSFPNGQALKKAVTMGWTDLTYTGVVQKDWYAIIDQQLTAALKPGVSVINPFEAMPPAPADAKPPKPFTTYNGSYTQDYYGTIHIVPNATGLLVYPGHSSTPLFLVPYDEDTFREIESGTAVKFTFGSKGNDDHVWINYFESPGRNGTFLRVSS